MVRYSIVADAYSLPTRCDFEGKSIIVEDKVFQENGKRQSLARIKKRHYKIIILKK